MTPTAVIVGRIHAGVCRRTMRTHALMLHDIEVARRAGMRVPGDAGLRTTVLAQAILWRDRAQKALRRTE